MDWESDPQLKELRDSFISSFEKRESLLASLLGRLDALDEMSRQPLLEEIRIAAHSIAGTAQSYDFPTLSLIGGAIDDLLSYGSPTLGEVKGSVPFLIDALKEGRLARKDPERLALLPEVVSLVSLAKGSLNNK